MTCEYDLTLETYVTMSKACFLCPFVLSDCDREHCVAADGVRRMFYAVNRELPSPQIRVKLLSTVYNSNYCIYSSSKFGF